MGRKRNIYCIIEQNIKKIRKEKNLTSLKLSKMYNLSHGYLKKPRS